MDSELREVIVSENFADLIIDYGGNVDILSRFQVYPMQLSNPLFAVVHLPITAITNQAVIEFGYATLPKLFGLISHESLEASGITRLRNIPNFDLRGQGVLIGFVDTGIDYSNPIFQNADGTTRIAAIWDQNIQSGNPPPIFGYGTEFSRSQINEALRSANPLEIVPSTDTNGHGTMIAGIAAGSSDVESDFEGIATGSDLVVVKLKPAKRYLKEFFEIPQDAVCFQENDIILGVDYLVQKAFELRRPMVICLALGSSQGGHGGRGFLSRYLSLIAPVPGIIVITATGNEGNARRHYLGRVDAVTRLDVVELNVGPGESGFCMELWGQAPSLFSIDIQSPFGEYIPRIAVSASENREITFIFEPTIINVDYVLVEGVSGDQLILLRFRNPTEGIWRFNVYERGDLSLDFNIWLPMEGFISENTYFIRSNPYITILEPGNAPGPVTVTAYNTADDSLYLNAGRGFTRRGLIKPDFAAPGVNITGPTLNQGFASFTGTSTASAHTAGVAALMLEWGISRGNIPGMSTIEFKVLAIRGARRSAELTYPNRDWGYGILDVYNIFDSLRTGVVS